MMGMCVIVWETNSMGTKYTYKPQQTIGCSCSYDQRFKNDIQSLAGAVCRLGDATAPGVTLEGPLAGILRRAAYLYRQPTDQACACMFVHAQPSKACAALQGDHLLHALP